MPDSYLYLIEKRWRSSLPSDSFFERLGSRVNNDDRVLSICSP